MRKGPYSLLQRLALLIMLCLLAETGKLHFSASAAPFHKHGGRQPREPAVSGSTLRACLLGFHQLPGHGVTVTQKHLLKDAVTLCMSCFQFLQEHIVCFFMGIS
jgi:hypothetical protein